MENYILSRGHFGLLFTRKIVILLSFRVIRVRKHVVETYRYSRSLICSFFTVAGTIPGDGQRGRKPGQHADEDLEVRDARGDGLGVPVARGRHLHGGVRQRHIRRRQLLRPEPVQGVLAVLPVRVPSSERRGHTGQGLGRRVQVLVQHQRVVLHSPAKGAGRD